MFKTNLLGTNPLHGIAALLLFFTLSTTLTAAPNLPAEAAALMRIENMTKLPGSSRGFPADNFYTFHRSDRLINKNGQALKYTDRNTMRIHNDGDATLVITKLTTTNTAMFRISGVSIPSGGLKVEPGRYVNAVVSFTGTGLVAKTLHTATLVVQSNAANAGTVKATFRGAYMKYLEGSNEIDVQQVFESFGFRTEMGKNSDGTFQVRPSSNFPTDAEINSGKLGDQILSKYFVQADLSKPLQMVQIAAFHSPGTAATALRNASNVGVGSMRYEHGGLYHQTLLPRESDVSTSLAGDFTAKITEPFRLHIAGYRSTGGNYSQELENKILGVRVYLVKDASGRVVPNEYIVVQDYVENGCGTGSANCDWNDNVHYLINARPAVAPSSSTIPDIAASAGIKKVYAVSDYFKRGFAGNKLTYSGRLATGGSLPSWISVNAETGTFTFNTPGNVGKQSIRITVTATDYNKLKTSSSFTVNTDGATAPSPTPDPTPTPGANSYWLEAECAQVGSRWSQVSSTAASNGKYLVVKTSTTNNALPADEAANRVRFVLSDTKAGAYNLFARIGAASVVNDSYWVRVNNGSWYEWKNGIVRSTGFAWSKLPGAALALKDGTNTIDFAFRESDTRLDKIYLTGGTTAPTGTGSTATNCGAAANATFWLEAECAQVGSKWAQGSSSKASNGKYVVVNSGSAKTAPPADDAANRVRFVLSDAKAGAYQLFARIGAPTVVNDSYWVRLNNGPWYEWKNGIVRSTDFAWSQLPGAPLLLKEGTNTVDFAFREEGTRLDKVYLTGSTTAPTGTGSTATNCGAVEEAANFWLEAECGSIGSGWAVESESGASNDGYVIFRGDRNLSTPTSNVPAQQVTYQVNLTKSGAYHLFLRADAPDANRNSLWVRIDDGSWVRMWQEIGGEQWLTSGFEWRKVNKDGVDMSFNLSAGAHTIRIANREPEVRLDKLYLSSSSTLPTGTGSGAINCTSSLSSLIAASAAARPAEISEVAERAPQVDLFPNPAISRLRVNLSSDYEGRVLMILTDLNGRRMRDLSFDKVGEQLSTEVEVADLPAGVYHLRLLEGDRQTVKPFVKR